MNKIDITALFQTYKGPELVDTSIMVEEVRTRSLLYKLMNLFYREDKGRW